ncbi:MAG TPA: outer membrane protein assembly factor BamD [Thermoanaerobaculia bacterium]|nr:outer membrane protein assembly factor BamD [Thermoanaerobaculia bacterium]
MKRSRLIIIAALLLTMLAACRHRGIRTQPVIDPEFAKLTKEQIFAKGEELFERRRYQRARTYYSHVYENYPNDPLGRRSLLRIADTYYMQGDPVNLVEAQYKYRDFINRYPGSDRADYAMLQIAMVSFQQMEKPDRDQQKTREALDKLNEMLNTFPRSPLREEAEKRRQEVLDRLAKHEHLIGRFYMRRGSWEAALRRLNYLIDQFPQYAERDSAFYDLGTALDQLGRKGEARLYFERVITEFPTSEWAEKAKKRLDQIKA